MKKRFFIFFLTATSFFAQTTYYVSNNSGNDSNTGNSISSPWKTISKVNSITFNPGDKVFFERDNIWFETLVPKSSGTLNAPITYGSYGNGARPIISGGYEITNWSLYSSNIYQANLLEIPKSIFLELADTVYWGTKKEAISALANERDYYLDESNNKIFVYANESTVGQYQKVFGSVRDWCIISSWDIDTHFSLFQDIELKYGREGGIRILDDNYVTIKNIKSHHNGAFDNGGHGVLLKGQHCKILNNFFYENGEHGIFLNFYPNTTKFISDVLIEGNLVWDNYHTGIDIMNDRGLAGGINNITIKNNSVWNKSDKTKEVSIQLLSWGTGTIDSVLICYNKVYNSTFQGYNIFQGTNEIKLYNNLSYKAKFSGFRIATDGTVYLYNNISLHSERYSVEAYNPENLSMDNNILYNGKIANVGFFTTSGGNILNSNIYSTQEEFYSGTGMGKNSYFEMPEFEDTTNLDFRLKTTSVGINAGANLGLENDFDYNPIMGNPEIGIYENPDARINKFLSVKVILEGTIFYNDYNYYSNMKTILYNNNLILSNQPYNTSPWNYNGNETINQTQTTPIVDWLLVELRDSLNNVLSRKAGVLRNTEFVTDIDGGPLKFELNGIVPFYIVIKHRNHLSIMCKETVDFTNSDTIFYDFTTSSNAYYGNSSGTKEVNNRWIMIAGDADANDTINNIDYQLVQNNITTNNVYSKFDINLDRNIDYYDLAVQNNIGKNSSVPQTQQLNKKSITTEVIKENNQITLSNYPNPFNPVTNISFNIPTDNSLVKLNIYNTLGQLVQTLLNGNLSKGKHELTFNGADLSSGIYIYTLQVNDKFLTKKLLLLK